jgi:VWFA-related protein
MTNSLDLVKEAAGQFLLRLLPDDKARVGAFNDKIQLSARFTNNRDELVSEAKNIDFGNGTRLWDAIALSLDELRGIDGRRVVLVFTDGDDMYSRSAKLSTVMERARNEEVMVYAIGFESSYFDGSRMVRSKPDSGLRKIADETGGGYFEVTKGTELGSTFTRVAQELHSQYVMAFSPGKLDGKVHKLSVRVKKQGMTARARRSYLATPEKDRITVSDKP